MQITCARDQQIGEIKKRAVNFCLEMISDADLFEARFPFKLPIEHKSLILAAVLLIANIAFEISCATGKNIHPGMGFYGKLKL